MTEELQSNTTPSWCVCWMYGQFPQLPWHVQHVDQAVCYGFGWLQSKLQKVHQTFQSMRNLFQLAVKSFATLLHPLEASRLRQEAGVGFSYQERCHATSNAHPQQNCYTDRPHKPQANMPSSMQRPLSSLPPKLTHARSRRPHRLATWQASKQVLDETGHITAHGQS